MDIKVFLIPILAVASLLVIIIGRKQLKQYRKTIFIISLVFFIIFTLLSILFAFSLGDYAIGPFFLYFSPIVGLIIALDLILFVNVYLIFVSKHVKDLLGNIIKYYSQHKDKRRNILIITGIILPVLITAGIVFSKNRKQKYAGADLQNISFYAVNLRGYNFQEANLQDARFWQDDLRRANFQGANLENADLSLSDLRGANFQGANLRNANLQGAELENADLSYSDLRGANLLVPLRNANFQGANLENADLSFYDLSGMNFQGANLRNANLHSANLGGADFSNSILEGARLTLARPIRNKEEINFSNANLKGANLKDADLLNANFQGATMPDGQKWSEDTDITKYTNNSGD